MSEQYSCNNCSVAEGFSEKSSWCKNEQVYQGVKCKVSDFPEKSAMIMYVSILLVLRGGGWVGIEFPERSVMYHLNGPVAVK